MESKLDKIMEFYEKSCVYGKTYEDRYDSVEKLKGYLDLGEFYDIYVKNIGGTELDDEIYLFSKKLIVKMVFQIKASGVYGDCRAYRVSEISNIRMIDDITYNRDIVLDIEFKDGTVISIDNRENVSDRDEDFADRQREINKSILESVFRDMLKTIGE